MGTTERHPTAGLADRALASVLDLSLVIAWAGVAAVIGLALRLLGVPIDTPVTQDAVAFTTLVLPVTLTLVAQESSARQASFGKSRRGLAVVGPGGGRIGPGRALVRTGTKLLPWQVAHTAVFHLIADPQASSWMVVAVAAQVAVLVSVVVTVRSGRALHDLVARTRVVVAGPGGETPAA